MANALKSPTNKFNTINNNRSALQSESKHSILKTPAVNASQRKTTFTSTNAETNT